MKTTIQSLCAALLLATSGWLSAAEAPAAPAPIKHSAEFDKLKSLVGTWSGKTDMGQGPVDITIQYRLIAAGSVLEERCMMGTPNEMVSMYYDQGGKLTMTHYCMLGNRPVMALKSSTANSLTFDLDAACCTFDTKKEGHMSGTTLTFVDENTLTSSCKASFGGQEVPEHSTTLKRVADKTTAAK